MTNDEAKNLLKLVSRATGAVYEHFGMHPPIALIFDGNGAIWPKRVDVGSSPEERENQARLVRSLAACARAKKVIFIGKSSVRKRGQGGDAGGESDRVEVAVFRLSSRDQVTYTIAREIVREDGKTKLGMVMDLGPKPGEFANLCPPLMSPAELKEKLPQNILMRSQNDLVNGLSETTRKHIAPLYARFGFEFGESASA